MTVSQEWNEVKPFIICDDSSALVHEEERPCPREQPICSSHFNPRHSSDHQQDPGSKVSSWQGVSCKDQVYILEE